MPDISMCRDSECPSRANCYRYRARPSNYQSYAAFKNKGLKCERFSPISEHDNLLPMSEIEKAKGTK